MAGVIEGYELSPQQRGLWPLVDANQGCGYASWLALAIDGDLDREALKRAWTVAISRHEILRTSFVETRDKPLQVVTDEVPPIDVQTWAHRASRRSLRRLATLMANQPAGPRHGNVRPVVIHDASRHQHVFYVRASALVADLVTMRLLAERLVDAYDDAIAGGGTPPDETPQYADVAEWLNCRLRSSELAHSRAHWDTQRRRMTHGTPLSTFHPRYLSGKIDRGIERRLRIVADAWHVSIDDVLLACWLVVLRRASGEDEDIVTVSKRFDGRRDDALRHALGPFARDLPLFVGVERDVTLRALAVEVRDQVARAYAFQDGFEWTTTADDSGPTSLPFHYGFEEWPKLERSGTPSFSLIEAFAITNRFTAFLDVRSRAHGLFVHLFYDAHRLTARTAAFLAERFYTVVRQAATFPERPVRGLRVMGARERQQTLARGQAKWTARTERTVIDLFREQVRRIPETVAVRDRHASLSYRELDIRSDALARRLVACGAGHETCVAILLPSSVDPIVAMLAALRCGAAYLPLDTAMPLSRLREILDDSSATIVVTDNQTCAAIDLPSDRHVVLVDVECTEDAPSTTYVAEPIDPDTIAYVIYTSGSTGTPKGIAITHRSLANYVHAVTAALELPPRASYALVSTIAADLGNTMIYPSLCNGGTLHVIDRECRMDPIAWGEYVQQHRIDCMKIVPAHLRLLLDTKDPARATPRQRIVLGGDVCDWALIDQLLTLAPRCLVSNHYGPTETTVGVLTTPLTAGRRNVARPPLGRPLAGSRMYILDERLEPVPFGSIGQLYVAGEGLARGYVRRAAMTADRFRPDPFSTQPGQRMYATGDLVSYTADGRLEFHGRIDHQVKVFGNRVELQEIEHVLSSHSDVAAAKVLARRDGDLTRLEAYVVATPGHVLSSVDLRWAVTRTLPEYCVPSHIVVVDHFPLTPNGKIDTAALSELGLVLAPSTATHATAPGTSALEDRLTTIWRDLLGIEEIGPTDNFFDLGGNSFLAVRLMARIQREHGVRVPLAALIGAGTVRTIAMLMGAAQEPSADRHLVPMQTTGSRPPLVGVHPGHGGVLCYRELAGHLGPEQPVYGLQSLDFDHGRAASNDLREMAARYLAEAVAALPADAPLILLGWSFGGLIAFEMARQSRARDARPTHLLLVDCRLPITAPTLATIAPSILLANLLFERPARAAPHAFSLEEIAALSVEQQLSTVAARTGTSIDRLVPEVIGRDRLEAYLQMRAARMEALRRYDLRPYDGATTLFRASDAGEPSPIPRLQSAFEEAARSADYGWTRWCSQGVEVIDVPGDHESVIAAPNVSHLAREVSACLARAARQEV